MNRRFSFQVSYLYLLFTIISGDPDAQQNYNNFLQHPQYSNPNSNYHSQNWVLQNPVHNHHAQNVPINYVPQPQFVDHGSYMVPNTFCPPCRPCATCPYCSSCPTCDRNPYCPVCPVCPNCPGCPTCYGCNTIPNTTPSHEEETDSHEEEDDYFHVRLEPISPDPLYLFSVPKDRCFVFKIKSQPYFRIHFGKSDGENFVSKFYSFIGLYAESDDHHTYKGSFVGFSDNVFQSWNQIALPAPNILNAKKYTKFWISWKENLYKLGIESTPKPLFEYNLNVTHLDDRITHVRFEPKLSARNSDILIAKHHKCPGEDVKV